MRIASIDLVEYPTGMVQLPLEVRQSARMLRSIVLILLSLVAMAVVLAPVTLIAAGVVEHPAILGEIAGRPVSSLLLLAGVAIVLSLLVFPLRAGLAAFGRRRRVLIAAAGIKIEDRGLTGTRRWGIPLTQFCGVSHHIRATLSGARHEIILVHRERGNDILLQLSTAAPERGADYFARLLDLPELPARTVYDIRRAAPIPVATREAAIQSAAA